MILILACSLFKTNRLLLPVLEGLSLVEVLHSIYNSRHHFSSIFLIEKFLSDSIPQLLQSLFLVCGNYLFVPSTEIKRDLRTLEPLLH